MRWFVVLMVLAACSASDDPSQDGLPGPGPDASSSADARPLADAAPDDKPVLFQIDFDYRYDHAGFFDDPARRLVLEGAADKWGQIFSSDYPAIEVGTPVRTRDPEDPDQPSLSLDLDREIDDLLIFVGCANLDGPSGNTAKSNHTAAIEVVVDTTLREELRARYRGADFQPWTGWISFDCEESWYFDPTLDTDDDIPGTDSDFWSVAMHEIGHVLGFGTADAFFELREDGPMRFVGSAAVAEHGGPVPLNTSGLHLDSSLTSGGSSTLMDPSRPGGARTPPTALDVAVFADLGHELAP